MQERSPNTHQTESTLSRDERWNLVGQHGATLWFTGLSGSGKSTIAKALELAILNQHRMAYLLDGDTMRHGLCGDLGFSSEDRHENIRRLLHVSTLLADAGVVALCAVISPFRKDRDAVRAQYEKQGLRFIEVFVDAPIETCEQRDPKGLYAKARAGEILDFTGIDAPYEAPTHPELTLTTGNLTVEECVAQCLNVLD